MRFSVYLNVLLIVIYALLTCNGRSATRGLKKELGSTGMSGKKAVSSVARSAKKQRTIGELSDAYEPVSLTLQLKFQRKNARQQIKLEKKRRKSLGRQWEYPVVFQASQLDEDDKNASRSKKLLPDGDSQGFVHLFLPIRQLQLKPIKVGLVSPDLSLMSWDQEESNALQQDRKRKEKKKRKKKKEKKIKDRKKTTVSVSRPADANRWNNSNAAVTSPPVVTNDPRKPGMLLRDELVASSKQDGDILPFLDDDFIPPLLNTLSTKDTRRWIDWLKCTVCLKNSQHEESPLCPSSLCAGNGTVENELERTLQETDLCQDLCTVWQNCENSKNIASLFDSLPSCPCTYPAGLMYDDRVWDPLQRRHFRWREISLENERADVYRSGAAFCIRSVTVMPQMALSAQQCCYDSLRRLLTRGTAAGTPALVSPDASTQLSKITEKLPWLACKGDFSRYHLQRPPDNKQNCTANPKEEEFQRQVLLAANY